MSFLYIRQNIVQEILQNGMRGRLLLTAPRAKATCVYLTKTYQNCWSSVTYILLYG